MRIALCEDNIEEQRKLYEQIEKALVFLHADATIDCFDNAESLLKACSETYYSIFFLDIYLRELSGIDAAIRIRRTCNYSPIVFVTRTDDFLAQSYSVWAIDYLIKPTKDNDVLKALNRSLEDIYGDDQKLEITISRLTEYIPFSDIYYIEGSNQNVLIYTRVGVYKPATSLKSIQKKLVDSRFVYSHRSFVINLDYVIAIQKGKVAMTNDVLLPLRPGTTEQIKLLWQRRKFEKVSKMK